MIKNISILFLSLILFSCVRPLQLRKLNVDRINNNGLYERNLFINKNISINKEPDWSTSIYGSFSHSTFAAVDTILFVVDLGGRITALNIESGKTLGQIKYKGGIEQAPIINKSNIIFILNDTEEKTSSLIIYDFVTGKEFRKVKIDGKFTNNIILSNENVYLVSDFGKVFKFSIYGMLAWEKNLNIKFFADPAADNENLFMASLDGHFYSIQLETGELNYSKKIAKNFQSGITLNNSNAFLGDDDGNLFSIDKTSGEINWSFNTEKKIVSLPSVDDHNVFIGNLNGDLFSIDKISGKLNWKNESDGLINTSALIFQNLIIQPNLKSEVDLIDKSSGDFLDKFLFEGRCRTTPFFFKDKVFLGIDKNEVFCYSINNN